MNAKMCAKQIKTAAKPTSVSINTRCAPWDIEVFFDGDCPLCCREIAMLRGLDRKKRIPYTEYRSRRFRFQRLRSLASTTDSRDSCPLTRWIVDQWNRCISSTVRCDRISLDNSIHPSTGNLVWFGTWIPTICTEPNKMGRPVFSIKRFLPSCQLKSTSVTNC